MAGAQRLLDDLRLDPDNECLWREDEVIALRPKAFALLRYLVDHPKRLVSKQELLDAVWPDAFVGDAVLKVCIRELRQAMGDTAGSPRFIETLHRRGYRFLVEAEVLADSTTQTDSATAPSSLATASAQTASPSSGRTPAAEISPATPALDLSQLRSPGVERDSDVFVGRLDSLRRLDAVRELAAEGQRQVLFITGAPGIGKTSLLRNWLAREAEQERFLCVQGQCVEQFGGGEAYMPVLEALGRLCRTEGNQGLVTMLRKLAPTWLAQMPWLIHEEDRERLQRELLGATRERMLREMAEFLEELTRTQPLVLALEDLHWSDLSTLDLIAYLARRRENARLLLIGTYRPVEVILREHPLRELKQELVLHKLAQELPLELLSREVVQNYLEARFPARALPEEIVPWLHARTEGNPLFLLHVLEFLLDHGWLQASDDDLKLQTSLDEIELGVPEDLRQMIEKQVERCSEDERRVLAAASLAVAEFSPAALAAALEGDLTPIEESCEALARRRQFIRMTGPVEYPDGIVTSRFEFIHALYPSVLSDNLPPSRRQRMHRRLGLNAERVYGEGSEAVASELAVHFAQGGDAGKAIAYSQLAAQTAARRYANREALQHLQQAEQLLAKLSDDERVTARMRQQEQLGVVQRSAGDMATAAKTFGDLAEFAERQGETVGPVKARLLQASALSWFDREACLETVRVATRAADALEDELLRAHAHGYSGYWSLLWEAFDAQDAESSANAVTAARAADDRELMGLHVPRYAFFQALRSEYTQAIESAEEGCRLAAELGDAFDFMLARFFQAWALHHSGQLGTLSQLLEDSSSMAERNEHHLWAMLFRLQRAWLFEQAGDAKAAESLAESTLERAIAANHGFGQLLGRILLGRAQRLSGQSALAMECFAAADQREARILMDWICDLPLREGLALCALDQEDPDHAIREAERLLELAAHCGERHYQACAHRIVAEAHLMKRAFAKSERAIEKALQQLEVGPLPLIGWRLHTTAATVFGHRRNKPAAEKHRALAVEAVQEFAQDLLDSELRASFLKSGEVQARIGQPEADALAAQADTLAAQEG